MNSKTQQLLEAAEEVLEMHLSVESESAWNKLSKAVNSLKTYNTIKVLEQLETDMKGSLDLTISSIKERKAIFEAIELFLTTLRKET